MGDVVRIGPGEAFAKMKEGFTYLDVRSEPEYAEGHPEGAFNVPLMHLGPGGMTPNTDFLRVVQATFARDAKLVLGCKTGGRSLRAAQALLEAGFTNIVEQRAGWDGARNPFGQVTEPGWSRVGLPVEVGEHEGRSYAALKRQA